MRNEIAETACETLLLVIVEMLLSAEEYYLMAQQQLMDGVDAGSGQVTGEPDVLDLGAKAPCPPHNLRP